MFKKIMPTTYLLVALLLGVVLHLFFPIIRFIHGPWNLLGLPAIIFGVWINLAADQAFKRAQTTVKPFEDSSTLVQDGVFNFSRNPMYLGFAAILLGVAILLGSLSPFFIVLLFMYLIDVLYIHAEESMLWADFGDEWEQYRLRVRKWL
jgi:protein-S-isoprenylcysteine O-methyltransferase Ste14